MNFICIYSRVLFFPIQFLSSTAIVVYNNAFSITSSHIHEIPAFSRNLPRLRLGRKNLMPYLIQVLEALLKMPLFFLTFFFTFSLLSQFLVFFFLFLFPSLFLSKHILLLNSFGNLPRVYVI